MPSTRPQVQCTATVVIQDDHWGDFVDRCELPSGHQGDHRHAMRACEPVAYIGWQGIAPYDGSREAHDGAT